MPKRTLDGFVKITREPKPAASNPEGLTTQSNEQPVQVNQHSSYPFPIPHLPASTISSLSSAATADRKPITNRPDLDLMYFRPFVPAATERDLFNFLRESLFFYRVKYNITRFGTNTEVNTPRYTTVFGVDATSSFSASKKETDAAGEDDHALVNAETGKAVLKGKYKCQPRPIPECLDYLRRVTEAATGAEFNFCLVNYYASGEDSISYHSDDESFLGSKPAIASLSLGAKRDFLMKHKPFPDSSPSSSALAEKERQAGPLKLQLASGDMVLMRGTTQSRWLHSLPKRKGADVDRGRINITFRRAMVPAGTENYYRYNVGGGTPFKWDAVRRVMLPWTRTAEKDAS